MRILGDKNIKKSFRLSKKEAAKIAVLAEEAGMSESDYIRLCLSKGPMDHLDVRNTLHDMLTEINHIGVNINQVVKNNNSGLYLPADKDRLLAYMQRLSSSMVEVVKQLGNN